RSRAEVRAVRPGLAARAGDLGPARVHQADEGRLAPHRRRLRGRDLPSQLPALSSVRALAGVSMVVALLTAIEAPAWAADVEAGRPRAEVSGACPGPAGNPTIPGTRTLAGQPVFFPHWQLIKFRDGRRKDAQMSPAAKDLTDTDMADLAAYYAKQTARSRPATTDPDKVAEGKRLATLHHCASCHRPDLTGQQQVPRLAGQDYEYLLRLLRGFKSKTASDLDGTMTMAVQPLRDEDIVSLVHFLASLGSTPKTQQ